LKHGPWTRHPVLAINAAICCKELFDWNHGAGTDGLVNDGAKAEGPAILWTRESIEKCIGRAQNKGVV
jgi:hypothetical protein